MLTQEQFIDAVQSAIPRFILNPPNTDQQSCIEHPIDNPLIIVAGPGSGKTTVLALRSLFLVFVHNLMPEEIIVTTFTKKAASEVRSRLIEWGLLLVDYLKTNPPTGVSASFSSWLDSVDVNRFYTGTLDSICEEALQTFRHPNDPVPVLVENFVGNAILGLSGLAASGAASDPNFNNYIAKFSLDGTTPFSMGEKALITRNIIDRFIYDQVDLSSYRSDVEHTAGRLCVLNSYDSYRQKMTENGMLDFALLEELFFERLRSGRLNRFTENIRALLVDEYQDTNPLQESIYFKIVELTNASFTIVGDDDQSLYRFRGATVELFADFIARFRSELPLAQIPQMKYLVDNYRSTPEIVAHFNDFIVTDNDFSGARVQPPKPSIIHRLPSNGIPVLGMFRPDINLLADDLSNLLHNVFDGSGHPLNINGTPLRITKNIHDGDFGDAVFLSHTVNEYARFRNNPPRMRLPLLLRNNLGARGINVFNPRGRSLRDIPEVQQLLGLILECIDPPNTLHPTGRIQEQETRLRNEAKNYFVEWRIRARDYITTNPSPSLPHTLSAFVNYWQNRTPQTSMQWPEEWPLLELCFKLISWFGNLRNDPEGQVYLEAIVRCISQSASYSTYRSLILHGKATHDDASVRQILFNVMTPIAVGQIDIDEEIMPHVPRNYLPVMTIHQAKGLEYPLVIVDVSSDYSINNNRQRFRRFPETPSNVSILEDDLSSHCAIGPLRTRRTDLQRTFEDLIRLYYVGFSRAQSVLILVGLDKCLRYSTTIKHIATGWRFDKTWAWRNDVPKPYPSLVNNLPIHLI